MPSKIERTKRARSERLSRDQKLQILTLRHHTDYTYAEIAERLGVTQRSVQYAILTGRPTPQFHKSGLYGYKLLRGALAESVILFVKSSPKTRRMPATQIAKLCFPGQEVGVDAVRSCLRRAGIKRRWAKVKPALTQAHAAARLAFAYAHLEWTPKDWLRVLWSDETWATSGLHGGHYVWCEDGKVL